jgi:general secretion pathway protein L
MSICRVRLGRDFPESGRFEWALVNELGSVLESGVSDLAMPPRGRPCEAVLAAELVLLERVALPAAQQRRLQSALRFLAEDSIVPDPARVHVAAARTPQKDVVCVGVVDREWFAQALARLARAGVAPVAAYPETLLLPLEADAWVVACNGDGSFVRTGEADGFALDSAAEDEPPVALRLALEAARAGGRLPQRVVLRAASGAALPNAAGWAAALDLPVEPGAAWRWSQARSRPRFELLQGEFAPRGTGGAWRETLRRPAVLAAALLVLMSVAIAADWALKSAERDRLQEEMRALYRQSFGESAVLVDPPLQMSRALTELRVAAGQGSASDFVALLNAVAESMPEPGAQRVEAIDYENGRVSLSLRAREPSKAAALAAQLRAKASAPGLEIRVEEGAGGALRLVAAVPGSK